MSKFNEGDKVRIVRQVEDYADGWDNTWEESMSDYVNDGKVYTVRDQNEYGVFLEEDNNWGWPPASLELVTE